LCESRQAAYADCMDDLTSALDRLRRFRDTFNAGELVDEESELFADDLTTIICAVEAFGEDVVAPDPEGGPA
jgi:hypothetical protein